MDEAAQAYVDEGMDAETAQQQAMTDAVYTQWRNKAINDTYEPGSTFKTLVLAAALEEGVTNPNDTFTCTGSIQVADREINCSNRSGHGTQDLATAVGHSCNPAFITMGQRLGQETFYNYLEAFGIVSQDGGATSTGIDLPGESTSIVWSLENFGTVELATASFGQRFQVTPIQLISAANAVVNGGYYYQPYVVDYVEDGDGNVTYSADTTALRQVISDSTSALCREMLEGVVANGLTGKNAYRAGYRIGGKTGTSETLKDVDGNGVNEYIVSFLGFAPADDPEIIVLVAFDSPQNVGSKSYPVTADGEYISGGTRRQAGNRRESGETNTNGPQTREDTKRRRGGTTTRRRATRTPRGGKEGGGPTSSNTKPPTPPAPPPGGGGGGGGTYIPKGNELVLYIGDATPPESVTVPNLSGLTPEEEAEQALNQAEPVHGGDRRLPVLYLCNPRL